MTQKKRAILRNFPVVGHFRYILESIRPEMQQYFVESNLSGRPIPRQTRSVVYQRAKGALQTLPFGTQMDVYDAGYEWVSHSLYPVHVDVKKLVVKIGGADCKQPYESKFFNISAMSYGSLSKNAIMALNLGAKEGGFSHNTGEGGISPHHLKYGGDLVWQIGTGYFGCRNLEGEFSKELFQKNAAHNSVKMIELKLSQGAKPAHGGILPGIKVDAEISSIRNVPIGKTVLSPPTHKAFNDEDGLIDFIQTLRELSGGKPVGFKLCIGHKDEFLKICEVMKSRKVYPDFITVDGAEGGTGAAPLEFSNHVGTPLKLAVSFVHNSLVKYGLREDVKIIAAGKLFTAFDLISVSSLGADVVNSARGMMLALGCIQALRCHNNQCPTGVATNQDHLVNGLDVKSKSKRIYGYQRASVEAFAELLGVMGRHHPSELTRDNIYRRINPTKVCTYEEIYGSYFN